MKEKLILSPPVDFGPLGEPLPRKNYNSPEEYFQELRLWLHQAYFWQAVNSNLPFYFLRGAIANSPNFPASQPASATNVPQQTTQQVPRQFPLGQANQGIQCRIPSFWKRIAAECIDFTILFFFKLGVTYIAVDFFDIVDVDKYLTFQNDAKFEYKTLLKMTEDIVVIELAYRVVVCLFETWWLAGNDRVGPGASPGKCLMSLRVVKCDVVIPVPGASPDDRTVVVKPGTRLGLTSSLCRSAIKNFILAVFIPTSFAFFYFQHNRTGYDMLCGSLVVEEPLMPPQPIQAQNQAR